VKPLCDFVVKNKSLNHKGSQSTTQSNPKVKSIKKPLFQQPPFDFFNPIPKETEKNAEIE